jgi:hypothetical protein
MTIATAPPDPTAGTAQNIITDGMFDAGLIGEGEVPTSDQFTSGMRRLNKIVNYFQTKGIKLFMQNDYALTAPILQVGLGLYSFGPGGNVSMNKPLKVLEGTAYYTDITNQNRRPIITLSRNEWDSMSTITEQGTVTGYYVDKQLLTLNVNLWMVPDTLNATGAVHLILLQQVGNFAFITDTMAFPPEWALALEWGFAFQVCTGQPPEVIERCKENAVFFQSELEDWDVEDASVVFQPDQRGRFVGRRFS